MYTAYLNDNLFYDDTSDSDSLFLSSASLSFEIGKAGSFTFTMPPSNLYYNQFNKLIDYVDVYRDDTLIFSGRVFDERADLYNNYTVTCEGLLAVLNDSIRYPIEFAGTMDDFLTQVISDHNDQVGTDKQLTIRTNDFSEEYIYRNWTNYETTYSRLSDVVDSFGGYLVVEKVDDVLYLDWLDGYDSTATQTITAGENLLNVEQTSSSEDIITVLIPLGAKDEDTDVRLTIADVNDGEIYIEDTDAIAEFGRIVGVNVWDDVTVNTNLLRKGQQYLATKNHSVVTIKVSAVDLAAMNSNIDYFNIGDTITVVSELNGIDGDFLCERMTLDLQNPTNNTLELNNTTQGYIGKRRQAESDLYNITEQTINDVQGVVESLAETEESLISTIEQTASSITSSVEARITAGDNNVLSQAKTLINQNAEAIEILAEKNETQELWITIDATEGVTIGRSDSDIKSVQDNDSYQFVDKSGNVLLTLDTDGLHSLLTEVTGQITYSDDSLEQWAMRKGSYIDGIGVNLDDVWIGG